MQTLKNSEFGTIFDSDNHYWESSDAFTRYRAAKFKDRGVRLIEQDGVVRYMLGDKPHPILPGPGDVHGRPVPGSLFDYFAGRTAQDPNNPALWSQQPKDHPEWYNRDARLQCMDEQGVEAVWMFPSHGVCIEGPMQPDIEAAQHIISGFNRWVDDEWGFAYKSRIFSAPLLTLSSLELAITELEWAISRGVRVVTLRNGPVYTAEGMRSPADPIYDPFWARAQEAGIVVTVHAGFDDGYQQVDQLIAKTWGMNVEGKSKTLAVGVGRKPDFDSQFIYMIQKHRLVRDFAAILIGHGLFTRFPGLKFAFIENGAEWVGPLLNSLAVAHVQHPNMFDENPIDQFHRNCWVSPFVEDNLTEIAKYIPVERILFGSDWPHAEGVAHPRDYFDHLDGFSEAQQIKIMRNNARQLTFG